MIQGATIRRASAIRTAAERTTIPESHSQAGTDTARARTAATALMPESATSRGAVSRCARNDPQESGDDSRFACPLRELPHVFQADFGCRSGEPPQHRVVHLLAAGRLLQRARVGVGNAVEVVLAIDVVARSRTQLIGVVCGKLDRSGDRLDLQLVDGDLERNRVWQLGEPADLRD